MEINKTDSETKIPRLRPCPPKLAAIMRDVNILPPSLALLTFHDAALLVGSRSSEAQRLVKAEEALEICLNYATEQAGGGSMLKDLISRSPSGLRDDSISSLEDRIYCYEFFRVARLSLQSLARMNKLLRPILEERELSEPQVSEMVKVWFGGSMEPGEVARIRECLECEQIFWAGRSDQTCCSPRCNHVRHSRRTREKYEKGGYQGAEQMEKERLRRKR